MASSETWTTLVTDLTTAPVDLAEEVDGAEHRRILVILALS